MRRRSAEQPLVVGGQAPGRRGPAAVVVVDGRRRRPASAMPRADSRRRSRPDGPRRRGPSVALDERGRVACRRSSRACSSRAGSGSVSGEQGLRPARRAPHDSRCGRSRLLGPARGAVDDGGDRHRDERRRRQGERVLGLGMVSVPDGVGEEPVDAAASRATAHDERRPAGRRRGRQRRSSARKSSTSSGRSCRPGSRRAGPRSAAARPTMASSPAASRTRSAQRRRPRRGGAAARPAAARAVTRCTSMSPEPAATCSPTPRREDRAASRGGGWRRGRSAWR